jgi:hypothetical protein
MEAGSEDGPEKAPTGDAWTDANARVWGGGAHQPDANREPVVLVRLPWGEAWILAGRLNSEGIEAHVSSDSLFDFIGLHTPISRRRFDVLVLKSQLQQAREVMRSVDRGPR